MADEREHDVGRRGRHVEEPATLVVSLDRFLPPFVQADIQKIWIMDGGLAVTLGHGGADLPPPGTEENDEPD